MGTPNTSLAESMMRKAVHYSPGYPSAVLVTEWHQSTGTVIGEFPGTSRAETESVTGALEAALASRRKAAAPPRRGGCQEAGLERLIGPCWQRLAEFRAAALAGAGDPRVPEAGAELAGFMADGAPVALETCDQSGITARLAPLGWYGNGTLRQFATGVHGPRNGRGTRLMDHLNVPPGGRLPQGGTGADGLKVGEGSRG